MASFIVTFKTNEVLSFMSTSTITIHHILMFGLINLRESSTKYMIVWDGGLLNWWHELNIMRISYLNHRCGKLSPPLFKSSLPPLQAPTNSHWSMHSFKNTIVETTIMVEMVSLRLISISINDGSSWHKFFNFSIPLINFLY